MYITGRCQVKWGEKYWESNDSERVKKKERGAKVQRTMHRARPEAVHSIGRAQDGVDNLRKNVKKNGGRSFLEFLRLSKAHPICHGRKKTEPKSSVSPARLSTSRWKVTRSSGERIKRSSRGHSRLAETRLRDQKTAKRRTSGIANISGKSILTGWVSGTRAKNMEGAEGRDGQGLDFSPEACPFRQGGRKGRKGKTSEGSRPKTGKQKSKKKGKEEAGRWAAWDDLHG